MKKSDLTVGNLATEHFRSWLLAPYKWFLIEAVVLVLAVGKAFDTGNMGSIIGVFLFWQTSIVSAYLFFVVTSFAVVRASGEQIVSRFSLALFGALPTFILYSQVHRQFHGWVLGYDVTLTSRLAAVLHYTIIGGLMLAFLVTLERGRTKAGADQVADVDTDKETGARAVGSDASLGNGKLPGVQQDEASDSEADIPWYLASEDHHVKIVYQDRIEITRSSLKKEMERWEGYGLQVHRSYWVREKAIAMRHRRGRQLVFELMDGVEIPIGRSYEKTILELCEVSRRLMRDSPESSNDDQGSAS